MMATHFVGTCRGLSQASCSRLLPRPAQAGRGPRLIPSMAAEVRAVQRHITARRQPGGVRACEQQKFKYSSQGGDLIVWR